MEHAPPDAIKAIKRNAIGDRDAIVFNSSGSQDIYIQPESPGREKLWNWLPAPKSRELNITMRLYSPRIDALDGRWKPPVIKRIK